MMSRSCSTAPQFSISDFQWHDLICSGDMTCLISRTKLQLSTKTAFDHDLKPQKPPYTPCPPPNPQPSQRVFPDALFGTPFDPILLWILPGWPLAAPAALLAFSAFFLLSAVAFFSFPFAMASFRAASRASGRCERRSLMTS